MDEHKKTASRIFNKPENEITEEERRAAKAINLGKMYGLKDVEPSCLNSVLQSDVTHKGLNVKISRKSDSTKLPTKNHETDAGYDMYAEDYTHENGQIVYDTGISLEIPAGYVGLLFPRSSVRNYQLTLSNSVGVIDSGYRGTIKFAFNYTDQRVFAKRYQIGDKIGQLIIMPYPEIHLEEVRSLSSTPRGDKGFGSSGV